MSVQKLDAVRVTQEKKPYTQILSTVIQNIQDPIAGFIWVYLSSLSPDWIVQKEHLKTKFKIGDDKLKNIFSYLKRCNLIEYQRIRDKKGKLIKNTIHVLCGEEFKQNEPYLPPPPVDNSSSSTGVDSTPVVTPVDKKNEPNKNGASIHRWSSHTCGPRALQIKQDTNKIKKQIKIKQTDDFFEKQKTETKRPSPPEYEEVMERVKNGRADQPSEIVQAYMEKRSK